MKTLTLTKPSVSEMAKRLSTHLSEAQSVDLKHTSALSALAAAFGWRSRQAMTADLKTGAAPDACAPDAAEAADPAGRDVRPVHVATVLHRHGEDVLADASDDAIRERLHAYVLQWWTEAEDEIREFLPEILSDGAKRLAALGEEDELTPDLFSRDEAIQVYFDSREDESYDIIVCPVDFGAAPAPAGPKRALPDIPAPEEVAGGWADRDAVRAMEQGYQLTLNARGCRWIARDPAPEIGDLLHEDDAAALLHVQTLAASGDATALKALRLHDTSPRSGPARPDPIELHECQNCGFVAPEEAMNKARDVRQRHEPGDPYSDRECPKCGALAYPVED